MQDRVLSGQDQSFARRRMRDELAPIHSRHEYFYTVPFNQCTGIFLQYPNDVFNASFLLVHGASRRRTTICISGCIKQIMEYEAERKLL